MIKGKGFLFACSFLALLSLEAIEHPNTNKCYEVSNSKWILRNVVVDDSENIYLYLDLLTYFFINKRCQYNILYYNFLQLK